MLDANLPTFQLEIRDILYNAAKEAYIKTLEITPENNPSFPANSKIREEYNKSINKTADKFGQTFADAAANDLSIKIKEFIQSASLNIVCQPQALATIVSPAGPCSGALAINDATAVIQII